MVTRTPLNVTVIRTLPVLYNSRLPSILCLNVTEITTKKLLPPKHNVRPSIMILRIIWCDMAVACNVTTSVVGLVSRQVVLSKIRQIRVRCNHRLKMHHEITIVRSENEARTTNKIWTKCKGLFDVTGSSASRNSCASKGYVL
jgi:hypothetical protein